jgi:Protein kinase domain
VVRGDEGREIAGFRIESEIGRGGMGVVYLAHQSFPERKVALKLLSPELASDPAFRGRFIRESNAAAAIEHPNIVPVHAAGENGGRLYLAMRYVEEPTCVPRWSATVPCPPRERPGSALRWPTHWRPPTSGAGVLGRLEAGRDEGRARVRSFTHIRADNGPRNDDG